ncbi:hypothetical protein M427DRAFT_46521 [Gonapodya prolifera JEL478]|uniref:Uncharacterized protein n=1 Tax=Gonapodya prolifera (strain JEL478) TaxID=1344416 RepID=A0A139A5N0_GONPJ|nr:hypothetical protein M427DRAFT_46521 [Gonapodya prolifera JEL478]|eukprot:KXS12086.1 hypothetical protein M427DRAFT_46521 [Gonapodya prolifera JEL478]
MTTSSGLMDLSLELIVVGLSAFLGTGLNKTFPSTLVLGNALSLFQPRSMLLNKRRWVLCYPYAAFILLSLSTHLGNRLVGPLPCWCPRFSESGVAPAHGHTIEVACVRPRGDTPALAEYATETDMHAVRGSKNAPLARILAPGRLQNGSRQTHHLRVSIAPARHALLGATVSGPWDLLAPLEDPPVKPSAPGKLAQALLLFSPANGTLALTYFKRALVLIAETSFFLPGTGPIPSLAITVPIPPSRRPPGPGHPKTVNITIIPSICLDASYPSLLLPAIASAPSSHPPILLNPASLWHTAAAEDRLATLATLSRSASVTAFTCATNSHGISAVIDSNGEFLAKPRAGGSLETDLPIPVAGVSIYATRLGSVGSLTSLLSLSLIGVGAVRAATAWAEKWRKQVPTAVLVEVAHGNWRMARPMTRMNPSTSNRLGLLIQSGKGCVMRGKVS